MRDASALGEDWYSSTLEIDGCPGHRELVRPLALWISKGIKKTHEKERKKLQGMLASQPDGTWDDGHAGLSIYWLTRYEANGAVSWEAEYRHPYGRPNGPWSFRNDFHIRQQKDGRWEVNLSIVLCRRENGGSGREPSRPSRRLGPILLDVLGLSPRQAESESWRLYRASVPMDGTVRSIGPYREDELRKLIHDKSRKYGVIVLGHGSSGASSPRNAAALGRRYQGSALVCKMDSLACARKLESMGVQPPAAGGLVFFPAGNKKPSERLDVQTIRRQGRRSFDKLDRALWSRPDIDRNANTREVETPPPKVAMVTRIAPSQPAGRQKRMTLCGLLTEKGLVEHPTQPAEVVLWLSKVFDETLYLTKEVVVAKAIPVKAAELWKVLWVMGSGLIEWLQEGLPEKTIERLFKEQSSRELALHESRETKNNPACKRERRRSVMGGTTHIWSHVKLSDEKRLYFAFDRSVFSGIVVGHIGTHLKTASHMK